MGPWERGVFTWLWGGRGHRATVGQKMRVTMWLWRPEETRGPWRDYGVEGTRAVGQARSVGFGGHGPGGVTLSLRR